MAQNRTGIPYGSTFQDIMYVNNNSTGLNTVLTQFADGLGNQCPMQLATNAINIDRSGGQTFQLDGVPLTATADLLNNLTGSSTDTYVLLSPSSALPNYRILTPGAGIQLIDSGATNPVTITLTGNAGAIEQINTNGIAVRVNSSTWVTRNLQSSGTINIVNPDGVAGSPVIDVINNTNVQQVQLSLGGALQATRHEINLIAGSGIGITVNDNGPDDRVDVLLTATGGGGGGGVSFVGAQPPVAGFTISGSPITTVGTFIFALSDDLAGIEALSTTGMVSRTATNTYTTRTISGVPTQISVSNGDGVSGPPVVGFASNAVFPGNGSITVPVGSTAQRPGTPTEGMLRENSDSHTPEIYNGTTWVTLGGGSSSPYLVVTPDFQVPTNAGTVTIPNSVGIEIIAPITNLASLMVVLPSSPVNGQIIKISSVMQISSVTFSGGTIVNAPTSFGAGTCVDFVYYTPNTTWYPAS